MFIMLPVWWLLIHLPVQRKCISISSRASPILARFGLMMRPPWENALNWGRLSRDTAARGFSTRYSFAADTIRLSALKSSMLIAATYFARTASEEISCSGGGGRWTLGGWWQAWPESLAVWECPDRSTAILACWKVHPWSFLWLVDGSRPCTSSRRCLLTALWVACACRRDVDTNTTKTSPLQEIRNLPGEHDCSATIPPSCAAGANEMPKVRCIYLDA